MSIQLEIGDALKYKFRFWCWKLHDCWKDWFPKKWKKNSVVVILRSTKLTRLIIIHVSTSHWTLCLTFPYIHRSSQSFFLEFRLPKYLSKYITWSETDSHHQIQWRRSLLSMWSSAAVSQLWVSIDNPYFS